MQRWLLSLLLVPLLAWAGALSVGQAAPPLSLPDAAGKTQTLSAYKGKVVLIDFWATYCKPCKAELPILDRWRAKYQKRGLEVLSVNVDPESQAALDFLKKTPVQFPVLFDPDDEVRAAWGDPDMPALFLIDRAGKLRFLHRGVLAEDDATFLAELERALSEKP